MRKTELIVSFTSYPARIENVHNVILSIINQTVKADKIILWLAPEQFPNKEKDLPKQLLNLRQYGLIIDWHKDIKSYKKLIPTLQQYPEAIIITVDDDLIYHPEMIEKLYSSYLSHKNDIHTHRATKFVYKNNQFDAIAGGKEYYKSACFLNKLCGGAGTLYPPHCLHPDVLNEDLFMKLAPTNYDQWFWLMGVRNNVRVRVVKRPEVELNYIPGSQETALCLQNDGENNLFWIQFQNIINHYPEILKKLMSDHKHRFKFIQKERLADGRRNIIVLGKTIFSYQKKHSEKECFTNTFASQLKYCGPKRLPILLRDKFFERTGKLPTEKLTTLAEKIIWASMFDVTPLKVQCADKFRVREYVHNIIGDKYLPQLYCVYKNSDEFNPNDLPDKFMLTLNCGSGQNYIVTDKAQINTPQVKSIIRKWLTYNNSQVCGEMQYYYIPPLVIARELVDIRTDLEYKLWCFGGRVEFICINSYARGHNSVGQRIYDKNWRHMSFFQSDGNGWEIDHEIPKPAFLQELIEITEKLAKPFDFVRVDFYETKSGKLVFGELTFSPTSGAIRWSPNHIGTDLKYGALFNLPKRDENGFAIR